MSTNRPILLFWKFFFLIFLFFLRKLGVFDWFFLEAIYILQTFGIVCYVFFFFGKQKFLMFPINDSDLSFSYLYKNNNK